MVHVYPCRFARLIVSCGRTLSFDIRYLDKMVIKVSLEVLRGNFDTNKHCCVSCDIVGSNNATFETVSGNHRFT